MHITGIIDLHITRNVFMHMTSEITIFVGYYLIQYMVSNEIIFPQFFIKSFLMDLLCFLIVTSSNYDIFDIAPRRKQISSKS